jgi:hypothetical protein
MDTSLSSYEIELVTDAEILLTKNQIIQKVSALFARLSEEYKECVNTGSSNRTDLINAKISKGENYKGLPYVILDYPRQFGRVDVFAIRTFFWWGNFFSITLQLSGEYRHTHFSALQQAIDKDVFTGWFLGCSDSAWEHHFESDNYESIEQGNNYSLEHLSTIKIAKKIPLNKWDEVELFLKDNFRYLMEVLSG